ncbi:MAG: hypothetical protein O7H41_11040 [Planctomycetota bacterium]|nr:hypothetical protein [Planctomycetota bacterium]
MDRTMTLRQKGAQAPPIHNVWEVRLRDFILRGPSDGKTEIAVLATVREKGERVGGFEGLIFGIHDPDGGIEPTASERPFHAAMALLHLPRQAGFSGPDANGETEWSATERLKLSNQGVLEAEYEWKILGPDPEADGAIHIRRDWKKRSRVGYASTGSFQEEFWTDPEQGHLIRYERSWLITWGGNPGKAEVEEEVKIELRLIDSTPPPGAPETALQLERLEALFDGFGSGAKLRKATRHRIEEFRRDHPESPFLGTLPPVELALDNLRRMENIGKDE